MQTMKKGPFEFNSGSPGIDPEKPTVLFIHGASISKGIWDPQVEGLAEWANTIALDLPGHGGSDGPGHDSVQGYAASVLEFVRLLDVASESLVLCGMSMGGAIVQSMLIQTPSCCRAGILINTGARLKVLPMIFEAVSNDFKGFIASSPAFSLSPETDRTVFEQQIITFSSQCDETTAFNDFTACNGFDVMDAIGSVKHPVLVVSSEHDMSTPPKYGAWLADHIPGSEHVHVRSAGHFANLEKQDIINPAIYRFLNRLGFSGRA